MPNQYRIAELIEIQSGFKIGIVIEINDLSGEMVYVIDTTYNTDTIITLYGRVIIYYLP